MAPEFLNVLIFEVDGQRHGVDAAKVQELLPALAVMSVPGATHDFEGVIDLRGTIVPVFDARRRFGAPTKDAALADHFIVVRHGDRLTALRVDRALELASLTADVETRDLCGRSTRVAKSAAGMVLVHSVDDLAADGGRGAS